MKSIYQLKTRNKLRSLIDRKIVKYINRRSADCLQQRGSRMAIYANDSIGIDINQYGIYEKEQLTVLFDFLEKLLPAPWQGAAVDIGANIGNHALFFSQRFDKVIAFEPHPKTYRLLVFNTENAANITAINCGLAEEAGELTLTEHTLNLGASSMVKNKHTGAERITISVDKLDNAMAEIGPIQLIKIDVEGYEINVLKGGVKTIKMHQPVIVLEQHADEFVNGSTPSLTFLAELGYKFCWLQRGSVSWSRGLSKLIDVHEYVTGVRHRIMTGNEVPARNHSMLIAVPEQLCNELGLEVEQ